jgi:putative endonuclease
MRYVYLLQSQSHPNQRYIGFTSDIQKRLTAHNAGQSPHTAKYRPWANIACFSFASCVHLRH